MIVIANVFPRLKTVKDLVRPLSKKRRFWTFFGNQHVKGSQTLVNSAWDICYHIFWSLWGNMIRKISPLLNFEILGTFNNRLTANENNPFGDSGDLQFPVQMQLSEKQKLSLIFLFHFWTCIKLYTFSKKRWSWYLMSFRNYRLSKAWLNHSLESAVSEPPSTVNVLMGLAPMRALLSYFSITLMGNDSQNISFIQSWNLRCVC